MQHTSLGNPEDANSVLARIELALRDEETPRWAIPILLCIRDDHIRLREHLLAHRRWEIPMLQILTAVITALTISFVLWLFAGRWAEIFIP